MSAQHTPVLAPDHKGMRVDYTGMLKHARNGLRNENPGVAEMLRQFTEHLTELGARYYAGDTAAVDEFLQLYCVGREARAAIAIAKAGSQA